MRKKKKDFISTHDGSELCDHEGNTLVFNPGDGVLTFAPARTELPEAEKKTSKVRHSGHYVDQKLQYSIPNKGQTSLFDIIDPNLKGEVERCEVKYEGIRLAAAEERLITTLLTLLKENSENKDQNSNKFYQGNIESGMPIEWGKENVHAPYLKISPSQLFKAYVDKDRYSGREQEDIEALLRSITEKKFLMKYDRKRKVQKGNKVITETDRIEKFDPLIAIVHYTRGLSDDELEKLDSGDQEIRQKKGELIIAFHPILTDQIDSKYIEYPSDINKRTIIAAGGQPKKVTLAVNCLRDALMRAKSSKLTIFEINADKLPYLLKLDKFIAQRRKKYVEDSIKSAILACKNLGLLLNWETVQGAEGQLKYRFEVNMKFE